MALRLDEPFRWGGSPKPPILPVPHDGMATVAKAATGLERFFNGTKPMLADWTDNPQKVMRTAQSLYYSHPWIRRAEKTVTAKVAGLDWHVEDENDDEVDDETPNPALQAVRDLLEKPQAALPSEDRQPGITTRRGLVSITSRHMGLCGVSYWFLDQMDQNGLPLAILYINPARVTVRATQTGNLVGYSLDADDYGNGGTFFRPDQVLPFFLEVPDFGSEAMGLVAAAMLKARIVTASDVHALSVLGTGGRIAGLVSPKDGYIDDPDRFAQLERDFRTVNDAPDAAKRMTILRGPIDFNKTAADPQELGLLDLGKTGRDDIFAIWGVPISQAGVPEARGLNSGESGKHEYEVLMTGPVHERVVAIEEVIQFDLLDRFAVAGINPQLIIEEPSFDDDGPAYTIAQQALNLPLTNNQRLALIGLDPLPEYGPDGEPLGLAIVLPSTLTAWAQGAEDGSTPDNPFAKAPKPKPVVTVTLPPVPQLGAGDPPPPAPAVGKAGFLGLRESVDKRMVPAVRKAVQAFLDAQRADIASRIRNASPRHLKDEDYWWRDWDKALSKALRPHVAGIAQTVTTRTADLLTAKAKPPRKVVAAVESVDLDPFTAKVERYVLAQTGTRIAGINDTTRQAIGALIRAGISESLTAQQIADRIEQMPAFDEARAELVARTETAFAYNAASITSFREFGVTQVQAIDGDGDPECQTRDGKVFGVDEADSIEDHPNGTLDWAPYFAEAA
jgi:SPP1 gp7 family putative phage head morphogenesis protein